MNASIISIARVVATSRLHLRDLVERFISLNGGKTDRNHRRHQELRQGIESHHNYNEMPPDPKPQ